MRKSKNSAYKAEPRNLPSKPILKILIRNPYITSAEVQRHLLLTGKSVQVSDVIGALEGFQSFDQVTSVMIKGQRSWVATENGVKHLLSSHKGATEFRNLSPLSEYPMFHYDEWVELGRVHYQGTKLTDIGEESITKEFRLLEWGFAHNNRNQGYYFAFFETIPQTTHGYIGLPNLIKEDVTGVTE